MAKKNVIELDNLNAFRTEKVPGAKPYIPDGGEKDNAAIKWAKENGYDNSKNYRKTPPVVPSTTANANPVATTPAQHAAKQPIAGASNTVNLPTDFNNGTDFDITEKATSDNLPLQSLGNGQVSFLQKDKRIPQSRASIAKFLNKSYGSTIPEDGSIESENQITRIYNANQGTIKKKLVEHGYITPKTQPVAESPKAEPTPEEKAQGLIDKAAATGKSWLQLYHEQMPKPEYNSKRANALQTNANLSVLADIIKLVGEGVTTDKGGTPIARQSMAPHLNAQLAQLNDLYKREVQAYNQNGFQYLMADERDKRARAAAVRAEQLRLSAENQKQKNWERQFEANGASKEEAAQLARERMAQSASQFNRKLAADNQKHKESLAASRDKKDNEKSYSIIVNGQSVKVPISYINDVSGKVKSTADVTSPSLAMQPAEVFSSNWNKYYDYKNGSFIPKVAPAAHVLRPGEYRENGQVIKKVPTTQKKVVSAKPYNPVTNAFVPQTSIDPSKYGGHKVN